MKLKNVAKITGLVLINELRLGKNNRNENYIYGYLIIEVSGFSTVRVNITVCEYTSRNKKDSRFEALVKALDFKSKAAYGNKADIIQITSGFIENRSFQNKYGINIKTVEVRTNFISKIDATRKGFSKFEIEAYIDSVSEDNVMVKWLDYHQLTEKFILKADNTVREELENKIGSIVLIKGTIDKSVDVVKDGEYLVATGASEESLYIEEIHESSNNSKENIKEFEGNMVKVQDDYNPFL